MPDDLPVHVSRQELHALEVPATFETDGSFDVVLVNHGEPLHVHLHLDDQLSDVAAIDASNHYVEGDSQRAVRVTVDTDRVPEDGVFGRLKVASAYGSQTRWIDVELEQPNPTQEPVEVDESLSQPQPADTDGDAESSVLARPEVPVLGLGAVALAVAAVAAVVVGDTVVLLGALAVLAGVIVALYLLLA